MRKKGVSFYYFKRKPLVVSNRYERWRGVVAFLKLQPHERLRVKWIIFYYSAAKENVTLTCSHFGISRKTFYEWFNRFRNSRKALRVLADQPRAPHHRRKCQE